MEQWLARWAHNPKVGGSNPPPATNFLVAAAHRRGIEQWLARRAHNPEVAGSNPVPAIHEIFETSEAASILASDVSLWEKIAVL